MARVLLAFRKGKQNALPYGLDCRAGGDCPCNNLRPQQPRAFPGPRPATPVPAIQSTVSIPADSQSVLTLSSGGRTFRITRELCRAQEAGSGFTRCRMLMLFTVCAVISTLLFLKLLPLSPGQWTMALYDPLTSRICPRQAPLPVASPSGTNEGDSSPGVSPRISPITTLHDFPRLGVSSNALSQVFHCHSSNDTSEESLRNILSDYVECCASMCREKLAEHVARHYKNIAELRLHFCDDDKKFVENCKTFFVLGDYFLQHGKNFTKNAKRWAKQSKQMTEYGRRSSKQSDEKQFGSAKTSPCAGDEHRRPLKRVSAELLHVRLQLRHVRRALTGLQRRAVSVRSSFHNLPDFAAEAAGGSIVATPLTRAYRPDVWETLWGFPLWRVEKSPRNIIQAAMEPGACWAFQGTEGRVVVQLALPTRVLAVGVEHIAPGAALRGRRLSAPKEFSVTALRWTHDSAGLTLGHFKYDLSAAPRQTFVIKEPSEHKFTAVMLQILSNYGNEDYTCVYRFRVHGDAIVQ